MMGYIQATDMLPQPRPSGGRWLIWSVGCLQCPLLAIPCAGPDPRSAAPPPLGWLGVDLLVCFRGDLLVWLRVMGPMLPVHRGDGLKGG